MKTDAALRVHIVAGRIWYQDSSSEPTRYPGHMGEFLEEAILTRVPAIRLIGDWTNARLLMELYEIRHRVAKIEVASPAIVARTRDRGLPGPVLYELGLCCRGPSLGGFHEMAETDYHTYALVHAYWTPSIVIGTIAGKVVKHPAWQALSFIPHLRVARIGRILAHIVDPRWYVDPCYPDRSSKFNQALQLNPYYQQLVSAGVTDSLCNDVLHSWKVAQESAIRDIYELTGPVPVADSQGAGIQPGDFCWRAWATGKNPAQADLRGSKRFADFLRQTWLDALYRNNAAVPEDRAGLFRPADFFKHEAEVFAFEQHMLKPQN
jgi:hypothetical protein